MSSRHLRTLSEFGRHGADLRVTCAECGRDVILSVMKLQERVGYDADPWRLPFRCGACGSRNVLRWADRGDDERKLPANVLSFPGTRVERALKSAAREKLRSVIVVGRTRDGTPISWVSTDEIGELLQLAEWFKLHILTK